MNKKSIILGSVLLVILLASILMWTHGKKAAYQGIVNIQTAEPKTAPPIHDIPSSVVRNMDNAEIKREKKLSELSLHQPATVYAKVVDQSGRPVPDARVVIASAIGGGANAQNLEQTSDSDGTLSFPRKWLVLSITVTKPGYQNLLASSATFQYAKTEFTPPSKPDPRLERGQACLG
jgi:hypothetical protein